MLNMNESVPLLDTPKKSILYSQSANLRVFLKDYERTFASNNNGRKPSKDDIKADTVVAAKYKEYNRVRDVLAGKLTYEALVAPAKSPSRKRKHERVDSGLAWSPRRQSCNATPRKNTLPHQTDPYDAPASATPKPIFLTAIGPTPQRDGRVFGLFDMMSTSAKSSRSIRSDDDRNRIVKVLMESPEQSQNFTIVQTPSQKRTKRTGDLLQHLMGTPRETPETGNGKHSRTPISEGKKFMLSQFFATPSATRYANVEVESGNPCKTPLRDSVLGRSPAGKRSPQATADADATPGYLRRTTSFKDRLLSASSPGLGESSNLFGSFGSGPPTLRHFRSIAKPASQPMPKPRHVHEEEYEDHDDDLDALHEIEGNNINVLAQDSQAPMSDNGDANNSETDKGEVASQPVRAWRKKGQKRTTKRARIKPAIAKLAQAPKFVAAEDADDSDEFDVPEVDEAQCAGSEIENGGPNEGQVRNPEHNEIDDDAASDYSDLVHRATKPKRRSNRATPQKTASKDDSNMKHDGKKTGSKKAGMINPNAQSHMNFRSLKIRNKNSKASGGRGKFGRRR